MAEAKRAARLRAAERRERLHKAGTGRARMAAGHALQAVGALRDLRAIAVYLPVRTEIDARPVMRALHGLGYRVAAPVIMGADQPLAFREWTPTVRVERGPLGVPHPVEGDWIEPDVMIVPLLAFDAEGWRLGYGGGYYDRTIAEARAARPTAIYGLAYAGQRVNATPHGPHDQRLDAVITENGVFRPDPSDALR